jgi:parallel beta-helix repeat protein
MKKLYSEILSLKMVSSLLILILGVMLSTAVSSQTLNGTDQCEDGPYTIGVTYSGNFRYFVLFRHNPDFTWDALQLIASGSSFSFDAIQDVGKYYVELYTFAQIQIDPDTGDPIIPDEPGGGTNVGSLMIYALPAIQTYQITGTYTGASSPYTVCDGFGEITITAETWTNPYGNDWNITYQLFKDGVEEQAPKTASSGQTITWSSLGAENPGTVYTVEAYRGIPDCVEDMSGTVTMLPGLISNLTKGTCYQTIQDAIDDADKDDEISIPAGSYTDPLDIEENIQFSSAGQLIFTSDITVLNGHVLTLNTDVEIQGTLDLTGATDQVVIGANTLTLNGEWANGLGSLVGGTTSNLVLGGTVGATAFRLAAINDLTLNLTGDVFMNSNLVVHGTLLLSDEFDVLAVNDNTLTLQNGVVDETGEGFIMGSENAELHLTGTGSTTLLFFSDEDFEVKFAEVTLNRESSTVKFESFFGDPMFIGTLNLTAGFLELTEDGLGNFQSLEVLNTFTDGGAFITDMSTILTFGGTYSAILVFEGVDPALGDLTVNIDGKLTLDNVVEIFNLDLEAGEVQTSNAIDFGIISNAGIITLGGDAVVDGLFSMVMDDNAIFNVGSHILTFNGVISLTKGTLNAGEESSLVFEGNGAFVLPENITTLNNLTINRTGGLSMSRDLELKGALDLQDGDFIVGDGGVAQYTLTINNPIEGTTANLKTTSNSTLHITGDAAGMQVPGARDLKALILDNEHGATLITGTLTIGSHLALTDGEFNLNGNTLSIADNGKITRNKTNDKAGSISAAPVFATTVLIEYTGTANILAGPELPAYPGNLGINANVTLNNAGGLELTVNSAINNLTLEAGNFSIGDNFLYFKGVYDLQGNQFLGGTNSQLYLVGSGGFAIPASLSTLENLYVYRGGNTTMSSDLDVKGLLEIDAVAGEFRIGGASTLTIYRPVGNNPEKMQADATASLVLNGTFFAIPVPANITALHNLTIGNTEGVSLVNDLVVNNALTFLADAARFDLDANTLTTNQITGSAFSASQFIVADAAKGGVLIHKDVHTTAVLLPIGTGTPEFAYAPLTISNDDEKDFTASVRFINFRDFTAPIPSTAYLPLEWEIERGDGTGTEAAEVTFSWGAPPDGTITTVGRYNETTEEWESAGTHDPIAGNSVTVSDITQFSSFAIYGDKSAVIYVNDNTGDDNNPGTIGQPKKTITEALKAVKDDGTGKLIIADFTYNEDVAVGFDVEFESNGFTIGQALTVNNSSTLTLDGDMTVDGSLTLVEGDLTLDNNTDLQIEGTLTLTGATDQVVIGANTLTLNGEWANGLGSLVGGTTSNLVLGGTVGATAFRLAAINDLTLNLTGDVFMNSNLVVHGTLLLSDEFDVLAVNDNTLTLQNGVVDETGEGFIMGSENAELHLTGTGSTTLLFFSDEDFEVKFAEVTLNRESSTVKFESFFGDPMFIGTLNLTAGFLELTEDGLGNFQSLEVLNTFTDGGAFITDMSTILTFGGTYSAILVFEGVDPALGDLTVNIDGKLTLDNIVEIFNLDLEAGEVQTSNAIDFGIISNAGIITLGGDAVVDGLFSMVMDDNAIFNVGSHILTFKGVISLTKGTLNAGEESSLVFEGNGAFVLPENITTLNNLTINRTGGLSMSRDLELKGALDLQDGDFIVGDGGVAQYTLTINNPIEGTTANLKTTSNSTLHITGDAAGMQVPGARDLKALILDNEHGATLITGTLTIGSHLALTDGEFNLNGNTLSIADNGKITRNKTNDKAGSISAAPVFATTVLIEYTGTANILAGPELPAYPGNLGINANVTLNNAGGLELTVNSAINNLTLEAGNFSIGDNFLYFKGVYDLQGNQFLGGTNSQLYLVGSGGFAIPASLSTLENLYVYRGGNTTMSSDLDVKGLLEIDAVAGEFRIGGASTLTIYRPVGNNPEKMQADATASLVLNGTFFAIPVPANITALHNLTIGNTEGVSLVNDLVVNNALTFLADAARFDLDANTLTTNQITGSAFSASQFIVADAAKGGVLIHKDVHTTAVLLPIGTGTPEFAYAPLTISNDDEKDFTASVRFINFRDFTAPIPSTAYLPLEWEIERGDGTGTEAAEVTFSWGAPPDGTITTVGRYNETTEEWESAGTHDPIAGNSVTVSDITQFSSFAIYGDKSAVIYVNDNTGDDNNPGTIGQPKKTITEALKAVKDDGTGKLIIADFTYNEDVAVGFDVEFESNGFTIGQALTVNNSSTLTLDGDMTVDGSLTLVEGDLTLDNNTDLQIEGTLTLTGATDQVVIGANTLTLNGEWANGLGSLVGGTTSNLVLGGTVGATAFRLAAINDLTLNLTGDVFMNSNLVVHGTLLLSDEFDVLAVNDNTLTLQNGVVDETGEGFIMGSENAELHLTGTGSTTLLFFSDEDFEVKFAEVTLNRESSTVKFESFFGDPMFIGTLNLTAGFLELTEDGLGNFQSLEVLNTFTDGGAFITDMSTILTFGGTYSAILVFEGVDPALGDLTVNIDGKLTLDNIVEIFNLDLEAGEVQTSNAIDFGIISNAGIITLGGDAVVDGLFSMVMDDNAIFNVGSHILTFNGVISLTKGTLNAGEESSLVFEGNGAFVLPENITTLNNLTINRTGGLSMSRDLELKGALDLQDGDFIVGDGGVAQYTLTINNPIEGTTANLKTTSNSTLHITGDAAGMQVPGARDLKALILDNEHGATLITGTLTIGSHLALTDGEFNLNGNTLSIADNGKITRNKTNDKAGSISAAPVFATTVLIEYTGTANILAGPELPAYPGNLGINANVTLNNAGGLELTVNSAINNLTLEAGNFSIGDNFLYFKGVYDLQGNQFLGGTNSQLYLVGSGGFAIPASLSTLENLYVYRGGNTTMSSDLDVKGLLEIDAVAGEFRIGGASTLTIYRPVGNNPEKMQADATASLVLNGTFFAIPVPANITALHNLTIGNTEGVSLVNDLVVNNALTFLADAARFDLDANTLTTNQITGSAFSASQFIVADAAKGGVLIHKDVHTTAVLLPIGTGTPEFAYAPLTISNDDEKDFTASVRFINFRDFTAPIPSTAYLPLEWEIERGDGTGTEAAEVTFSWGAPPDGTITTVGRYNETTEEWESAGTHDPIAGNSVTVSDITQFSSFAIFGGKTAEIYVNDGTGNDYNPGTIVQPKKTINEALKAVADAGTIYVAAGTSYTENITINNEGLTMEPYGTGAKPVIDGGSSGTVVSITSNNVTFDGFEVRNSGAGNVAGIALSGVDNCNILNNDVKNNQIGIAIVDNASGDNSSDNTISGNTIQNNTTYGVLIDYAFFNTSENTSNTIDENTISGSGAGIYLGETASLNTISNNTVTGNSVHGIELYHADDNDITGNTISGNANAGIRLAGSKNTEITGNTITGGAQADGIRVFTSGTSRTSTGTVINENNISGHTRGVVSDGAEVDAQYNWWGSEYGPNHLDNPFVPTAGDQVSDNVDFDPWYYEDTRSTLALYTKDFFAADKTYDGTTDVITSSFDDNRVSGDVLDFTYVVEFADKNVDTEIAVNFTNIIIVTPQDGGNAYEYTLLPLAKSGSTTADILPKTLLVTATAGQFKVYGEADPVFAYTASGFELGDDESIMTGALSRDAGVDVGFYAITIGNLSAGGNYTIDFTSNDFEITQKTLSVTATAGQFKVYGEADPVFAYTASGFELGDDESIMTGALSRDAGVDVGFYAITIGNLSAGGNYTIDFTSNDFEITQKTLSVTATAGQFKVYGEADPVFAYTASGFELGDDESIMTGALSRDAGVDVGFYAITIGNLSAGGNYTIDFTSNDFEITQKTLSVTATAGQFKVYGEADPVFAYTASGFELGDDESIMTGALSRDAGVDVGFYAITIGNLSAGGNYTIDFTSNDFEITQKTLSVTATAGQFKVYGEADPVFAYTASGFELGDDESIMTGALSRDAGVDVGFYAITIGNLSAGGNYTIDFTSNDFEITQKTLSVTATAGQFKVYGEADPVFAYTASGFELGDDESIMTGALSRDAGVDVGFYAITIGNLSAGGNYTIDFTSNDFEITQKTLSVTATAGQFKVYGEADPVFAYTASGFELGDDESIMTGALSRDAGVDVGFYAITIGNLSAGGNYTIDFTSNDFEITQKTLSVTATAGQFKVYGEADPVFAYTASGFELGDDESIMTGALSRDAGVDVGFYAITIGNLSAGGNYTIDFTSNDFEITPKPLLISGTFTAFDKIEDGTTDATINNNSLTLDGIVGADVVNLTAVAAFVDANVGTGKNVSLTTASSIDNSNYSIDPIGQTPAAPTATANILDDLTPVITDLNGDPASTIANEGDQLTYMVTHRGTGFSYIWSFVELPNTNDILAQSGNQVEVEWNESGTLRVTETYNSGSGIPIVSTSDLVVDVTQIALKGTIRYNRNNGNHTPIQYVDVKVMDGATEVASATTNAAGYFEIPALANDNYTLELSTTIPWGGGNSTDALAIQRAAIGSYPVFYLPANADFILRNKVADVNANALVNATDALLVKRRAIQLVNSFAAGDWAFWAQGDGLLSNTTAGKATLAYEHSGPKQFDILAMTYGDVNASYNFVATPPSKMLSPVDAEGLMIVARGEKVNVPVKLSNFGELGALTMYLKYDAALINVHELNTNVPGLMYNINGDQINVAWSDLDGLRMGADPVLFTLTLQAISDISESDVLFYMDNRTQFADLTANELDNVKILIDRLSTSADADVEQYYTISCYPNPVQEVLTISYKLPEKARVHLSIMNALGEVNTIITDQHQMPGQHTARFSTTDSGLQNGIYYCRIIAEGETTSFTKVVKFVVFK